MYEFTKIIQIFLDQQVSPASNPDYDWQALDADPDLAK
jgi:hypothetical protein